MFTPQWATPLIIEDIESRYRGFLDDEEDEEEEEFLGEDEEDE